MVPNERKGPAPCFVGMNFCGNHALVNDPKIPLPTCWMYPNHTGVKDNRATEAGRGKEKDVWALEQSIDRGYAVATFYNGDIDPDRKDKREGHSAVLADYESTRDRPAAKPATIVAWAWGISRAVDYLVTDKDIDAKRIAVVGHSRLGKTALLAAAFDERIALAIPHQAGCGGTAPSRGKVPRRIGQAASTPASRTGSTTTSRSSTTIRASCRSTRIAWRRWWRRGRCCSATPSRTSGPTRKGQFEVLKAAEPVYKLLGAGGLDAKEMPEPGKLIDSTLGYYIRPGKHSMTKEDWKVFLDFADKNLPRPAAAGK